MRFDTLEQWLEWQTALHDKAIDLGLDRVRAVADRLDIDRIAGCVITVAGTNGKGSTVAAYENWLVNNGYSVVSYTSPHLLHYNESVRCNRDMVSDADLCRAFEAIENARGDTPLTYFEYGTLAALFIAQTRQPDFALLEVGLGGRLDAVNIIDADLVHLTPIGLDHQAWLGDDRESIGREKAGVLRAGVDVILNDIDPPGSVLDAIQALDCHCLRIGHDYEARVLNDHEFVWHGEGREICFERVLTGQHQVANLAGVVAGLSRLFPFDQMDDQQLRDGFRGTRVAGRFQTLESQLPCRLIVDVGHNQDAARALATNLRELSGTDARVIVLLGMLEDKEPSLFVDALKSSVDEWWLVSLGTDRGLSASDLAGRIGPQVEPIQRFESIDAALELALSSLHNRDIMLVTGSFVTVETLLQALPAAENQT